MGFAPIDGCDPSGIDIDAKDVEALVGESDRQRQAHIAQAHNGDDAGVVIDLV
jgi:hypothetical protein